MDLSETFEKLFEQNPYSGELLELLRSAKDNPGEAPRLLASFNKKVTTDIELERRMLNSRIVSLRLSRDSPNTLAEMKSIIEEFFDIAARRRLWGVAYSPNLERAYIDFLNQQKRADADRWERVTLAMGDDTVDMILDGRVAYWTVQAKEQARRMRQHAVVSAPSGGSATEPEGNACRPSADEALAVIEPPTHEKAIEGSPPGATETAPSVNAENPASGGSGDTGSTDAETIAERARRRKAVVMPILEKKHWKPGRLVTKSGVGKATVYGYLDGSRAWIDPDNREAIAQELGIKPEELPD